ncbi:hypothetical protein HYDPIDRAFT_88086, partial [Hydnomerulius pinastri MD-312]
LMSIPRTFAQDVWIRKTVGLSGYSCLVYDYILTLDDEVKFIWQAPWTVTKVIFLINRYGNLLSQTFIHVIETGWVVHNSQDLCQRFNLFTSIFMLLSSESIHILVLFRAWAIWGCQKRVATTLISVYFIYLLLTLGMTGFGTNTENCAYRSLYASLHTDIYVCWISLDCLRRVHPHVGLVHEFQYLDVVGICVGVMPRT